MKKVLLTIGFCLLLFTVLVTGCEGQDANSEEVNAIVSNVLETNAAIDTCKFEMSLLQNFHVEKTAEYADIPDSMTLTGNGEGMLDSVNGEIKMRLSTSIEMAGQVVQNMPMETYIVDGYLYSMYPTPEGDMEWIKMAMPDDMWDKQNQLVQQAEIMETADSIKYLGEEIVDGVECYVVEIDPSDETIDKLLSQIDMPVPDSNLSTNLSDLFQDLVIKQWVSKDSYLFVKMKEHMVMEITPEDIGLTGNEFKKMYVDADVEMKFFDYNEPLSIELPAGALDAREIIE